MSNSLPVIEIHSVSKEFKDGNTKRKILDSIDLSIWQGENVIIEGSSGSGKSTLLKMIAGIILPTAGEIHVHNQLLKDQTEPSWRLKTFGMVFQHDYLLKDLNVTENILLQSEMLGFKPKSMLKRALNILAYLNLSHLKDAYPETLSGGERQRVSIARAFICNPDIILADEPTASLDQETAIELYRKLTETCRDQGKTLVTVTHDPRFSKLSNRTLMIQKGKLI